MKSHTSEFKEEIKTLGKQQSVRITYTLNNEQIILTNEDINSATPNFETSLLKSVMKELELDSNVSIPKDTEIKFEYGLLVNGAYEYLDYGNYIVYSSEKQEDTLSYKITCYDKILYSMKDYEHIEITYPCTIKQYLVALCNKIGLTFKDSDFANAGRQITNELFMTINEDGTYGSMGYTYRDVLDQIAETTGGCICMTLDDKVEVRYINELYNKKSVTGNPIYITDSIESELTIDKIEGSYKQDKVSSPDYPSKIETVGNNINFINMRDSEENTSNGMVYSIKNNVLKIKGTATANITLIFTSKTQVDLKANTYTLNANKNGSLIGVFGYYIYGTLTPSGSRKVLIDGGNLASSTNTGIKTQTLTENNYYDCCFGIYFAKNCTTDMTLTPKLEEGSVATPYSSYNQGSVKINVVNSDNTESQAFIMPIQQEMLNGDYISNVEHHEWGKVVLTGLETWTLSDKGFILSLNVVDSVFQNRDKTKFEGFCNYFKTENTSQTWSKLNYCGWNAGGVFWIREDHHIANNIDDFNTWLKSKYDAGNPVTIRYKLAEPIDLELTEEQKAVRNIKLYTYKDITNINTSDDLVKLDITYITSKETIDEEYINDTNVNFGEKYRTNQFNCACKSWRK